MSDKKTTKLTIYENRATGITSSAFGSNINAMGFNLLFIASKNPKLAVEIMELYAKARKIQATDPDAPDEDYSLFSQRLEKLPHNDASE